MNVPPLDSNDLHLDECRHLYEAMKYSHCHREGHAHEDGFVAGWCAAMRFNAAPQPSIADLSSAPSQEGVGRGNAAVAAPFWRRITRWLRP